MTADDASSNWLSDDTGPAREGDPIRGGNPAKWASLFAGEIERVYVYSCYDTTGVGTLTSFLPQTLGLEPFRGREYRWHADGTRLSAAELTEVARMLAARERWIAEGIDEGWAREFMSQAGAIIYIESRYSRFQVQMSDGASQGPNAPLQLPMALHRLAQTRFPDKLLFATKLQQRRALRRLSVTRGKRPPAPAGEPQDKAPW